MKKFGKAAFLAAAVILLAGCGASGQAQAPAEAGNSAEAGTSAEAETPVQKEESAESLQGSEGGETASVLTDSEGKPYGFRLVDEELFSMDLLEVLEVETGGRMFILQTRNDTEDELICTIEQVRFNDHILAMEDQDIYPEAGVTETEELIELRDAFMVVERSGVRINKITCDIMVQSWETDENGEYKVIYEGSPEIVFPEDFEPRLVCMPTLSMRAQEQVLHEDERVRITLTHLGKFVGTSNYYALEGIVKTENLSNGEIPVYVQGIRVNGYYVEMSGAPRGNIPAGSVLFTEFECARSDLESAGITEIESVDLQIMTSAEENTGTVYGNAGGTWYPVTLAEHGTGGEGSGTRIPVYEDDYIAVELTGASTEWNEYDWTDPSGSFEWNFTFTNKTDKDLNITFEDFIIDGEPDTDEFGDRYLMLCELGAGSRTNEHIWQSITEEAPLPEISFRVQITSAGGGSLYNYSEEYVTITKEMAAQVMSEESEE